MSGYVSPLPVKLGHVTKRPYHQFPGPNGAVTSCQPEHCRECWREKNWREGQTHGE